MSLLRLYSLFEAGTPNTAHARAAGSAAAKKKKRRPPSLAGSVQRPDWHYPELDGEVGDDDDSGGTFSDPEDDDTDLGPDMDYDDPSEPESDGEDQADDEPAKPTTAFASKPAPPSKALQGGQAGVTVKADKATLKALARAFDAVRTKDADLQDWVDDCIREIERAGKSSDGSVTLPKFEATPDLDDDFNDGGSEEDY